MAQELTYKYLGDRDLRDAKILLQSHSASMAGRLAQQAVEKNLKQYVNDHGTTEDLFLLSAHNTVKLYDKVASLGGVISNRQDRMMMSALREYYYDINYPGVDCRELTLEEAAEAVHFAERFIAQIQFQNPSG